MHTELTEREAALLGPRGMKEPGTKPWVYQMLYSLKRQWQRLEYTEAEWKQTLDELEAVRAWDVLGYPGEDAMLQAETGRTRKRPIEDYDAACRLIAKHYNGIEGRWSYEAFDYVNATFFGSQLPTPLIVWVITPYGGCLGLTRISAAPVITLHPALLGEGWKDGGERNPWGIDHALLGVRYALDVLIHECMHVSVNHLLGGSTGESSHNCRQWASEVNRIAPLLGFDGVCAGRSTVKRVPIEGELTKRGKQPTKVQRVHEGNIPLSVSARFPYMLRAARNMTDYYYEKALPFPNAFDTVVTDS